MSDIEYHGVPLSQLEINDVDWTNRGEYISTRSQRRRGDVDILPEWATEAVFDDERLVGLDPATKSGWGIRVVGQSLRLNRVLVVILIPKHMPTLDGSWWGVTAWVANSTTQRRYYANDPIGGEGQ